MRRDRQRRGLASAVEHSRDHAGDTGDGGLAIIDASNEVLLLARPEVTSALRYLVARIQSSEKGAVPSRLAFTSALSGEGVTFVSRTVAAIVAHDLRQSVCIVDLNWWGQGEQSRSMSGGRSVGVAEVLRGDVQIGDAVCATTTPNLHILPAGDAEVSERSALAKAPALTDLLVEMAGCFDHVILDIPAVLTTSESITLASYAEAFVLVIRQGVTAETQVQQALAELSHMVSLGVVLNRASSRIPAPVARMLAG